METDHEREGKTREKGRQREEKQEKTREKSSEGEKTKADVEMINEIAGGGGQMRGKLLRREGKRVPVLIYVKSY